MCCYMFNNQLSREEKIPLFVELADFTSFINMMSLILQLGKYVPNHLIGLSSYQFQPTSD